MWPTLALAESEGELLPLEAREQIGQIVVDARLAAQRMRQRTR